jgi:hypothetical protein
MPALRSEVPGEGTPRRLHALCWTRPWRQAHLQLPCLCVANTPFEVGANHVFDGLRCRVEKLIAKVAVLGLFHNGKCRLGYHMLLATAELSVRTAAVWSRLLRPQYQCDGYGDWARYLK